MREIHTVVSVKKGKVENLQDEESYYIYKKGLMEGELDNKKKEIQDLTERYKLLQNKNKVIRQNRKIK